MEDNQVISAISTMAVNLFLLFHRGMVRLCKKWPRLQILLLVHSEEMHEDGSDYEQKEEGSHQYGVAYKQEEDGGRQGEVIDEQDKGGSHQQAVTQKQG